MVKIRAFSIPAPQAPMCYPPTASPTGSDFSDRTEQGLLSPNQDEMLRRIQYAERIDRQAKYVSEGLAKNMIKLGEINKAHLNIGQLHAQEARALADQMEYASRITTIEQRLAELASTTNAISDNNLRAEFEILTENKRILECMLRNIPRQLKGIRETIPWAIDAARDLEETYAGIVSGMRQWRLLAAQTAKWSLEGEPAHVALHEFIDGVSQGPPAHVPRLS